MRGAHHALTWFEIESIDSREVDRRFRLEVPSKIGAQYRIPSKVIPAREIAHKRGISIRHGGNEEALPQPRETGRHVLPCREVVPCKCQLV
jgi:hypothetical protein